MKRGSRKQKLVAEINITPFTDVILVLLVIFMIATPLITELGIKVKLPQTKSGQPLEGAVRQAKAQITITAEGPVYLNGKLVTRKELVIQMYALHKNNPDTSVILRADRLVRFKEVVGVLDPLSELGITKFDIAATNQQ